MCLIVFAYKAHPEFPLIMAGNRDEFYHRPAMSLFKWNTNPSIIAGKDVKAGGTWLGTNKNGKIAALTNYRDLNNIKENTPSRGEIITNFLTSNDDTEKSLKQLERRSELYNGFNLIAGTPNRLYYLSNYGHPVEPVQPGIHVISNASLNTPWPKTKWAIDRFSSLLEIGAIDDDSIFEMLRNSEKYPIELLPDTGLSDEMEVAVSSVFILTDNYGTRSSSFITVNNNHQLSFSENVYKSGTKIIESQKNISIQLEPDYI